MILLRNSKRENKDFLHIAVFDWLLDQFEKIRKKNTIHHLLRWIFSFSMIVLEEKVENRPRNYLHRSGGWHSNEGDDEQSWRMNRENNCIHPLLFADPSPSANDFLVIRENMYTV